MFDLEEKTFYYVKTPLNTVEIMKGNEVQGIYTGIPDATKIFKILGKVPDYETFKSQEEKVDNLTTSLVTIHTQCCLWLPKSVINCDNSKTSKIKTIKNFIERTMDK